ncbi:MAG: 2,3-bisphosphoglycerate-independent phosphoglycerate mutase [Candidatus Colwellbacteria bacterium]|nr:2,3-bisphosphoglycerate-independent phosphoglycerate mutase [Candidatus Colwellbacteria bacterium]
MTNQPNQNRERRRVALIILDGWGVGPRNAGNPIARAKLETINSLEDNFPACTLQASGIAVGLPWQEEGNSEVGHLTLGGGRVIYQNFMKITAAIRDGSFFTNQTLLDVMERAKGATLHLVGLVGEGVVHSSFDHLEALISLAERLGVNWRVQAISDGKDSAPRRALSALGKLPHDRIGSVSGRAYAMDRDGKPERISEAWKAMTDRGTGAESAARVIENAYARGFGDEFVPPTPIGEPSQRVKPGDAVIFFNFREDGLRALVEMFESSRDELPVAMVTMVPYGSELDATGAFRQETVANSVGEVIAQRGAAQLRVAESEKRAHVTYFFNGFREEPFEGEYRVIIPGKRVARHDEAPEMMAEEVTTRILTALEEKRYGFVLANYANPDMIAHTGNFDATLRAVETVDQELGKLVEGARKTGTLLVITADHGNAERLLDARTGRAETRHDASPVPFYLVGEEFRLPEPKPPEKRLRSEREPLGTLADVAPTILELMGIEKPIEMTGRSLLSKLIGAQ